jgi:abortive infection bacteriophage resistance protein
MDKWNYMKLKNFYTIKDIVFKLRPPTEFEKIFATYTLDKGPLTIIYRESKN